MDPYIEASDCPYCNDQHTGIKLTLLHPALTIDEIKTALKYRGLNGYSNMSKSELISYYYTESKTRNIGQVII